MTDSDDKLRKTPATDSLRSRLLNGFDLDTDSSGLVLLFLALFAPGLAIVGYAAAEALTSSTWVGIAGALMGLVAGVAVVRDFLRWRTSWIGVLLAVTFGALLLAAYL